MKGWNMKKYLLTGLMSVSFTAIAVASNSNNVEQDADLRAAMALSMEWNDSSVAMEEVPVEAFDPKEALRKAHEARRDLDAIEQDLFSRPGTSYRAELENALGTAEMFLQEARSSTGAEAEGNMRMAEEFIGEVRKSHLAQWLLKQKDFKDGALSNLYTRVKDFLEPHSKKSNDNDNNAPQMVPVDDTEIKAARWRAEVQETISSVDSIMARVNARNLEWEAMGAARNAQLREEMEPAEPYLDVVVNPLVREQYMPKVEILDDWPERSLSEILKERQQEAAELRWKLMLVDEWAKKAYSEDEKVATESKALLKQAMAGLEKNDLIKWLETFDSLERSKSAEATELYNLAKATQQQIRIILDETAPVLTAEQQVVERLRQQYRDTKKHVKQLAAAAKNRPPELKDLPTIIVVGEQIYAFALAHAALPEDQKLLTADQMQKRLTKVEMLQQVIGTRLDGLVGEDFTVLESWHPDNAALLKVQEGLQRLAELKEMNSREVRRAEPVVVPVSDKGKEEY